MFEELLFCNFIGAGNSVLSFKPMTKASSPMQHFYWCCSLLCILSCPAALSWQARFASLSDSRDEPLLQHDKCSYSGCAVNTATQRSALIFNHDVSLWRKCPLRLPRASVSSAYSAIEEKSLFLLNVNQNDPRVTSTISCFGWCRT